MRILAVSPESEYADEPELIMRLLDAGLDRYHVRKPSWDLAAYGSLIEAVAVAYRSRLSIHQFPELSQRYSIGFHLKDAEAGSTAPAGESHGEVIAFGPRLRSRSLHRLSGLAASVSGFYYSFLSPVYPSLSKPGYRATWSQAELRAALALPRSGRLYALGGITPANAPKALELGFDGVVLHGALWQSSDPVQVVRHCRKELV